MPLLWAGCVAFHGAPTYSPTYGGAVSDTDPIHKGMNQVHTPTQKRVSIDTSGKGVNLPDCTDLCNRLKIERNPITTLCGQ